MLAQRVAADDGQGDQPVLDRGDGAGQRQGVVGVPGHAETQGDRLDDGLCPAQSVT